MGGVYIQCGSFIGSDKSGSAIEGLVDELLPLADLPQQRALERVRAALDAEPDGDYGRVPQADAVNLIALLESYVADIHRRHGPIAHPFELINRDFAENPSLDPGAAKYGQSRGWRLYCATDLAEACKVAAQEGEDIILTWD